METDQLNEVRIKLRLTAWMCDNQYHFCVGNDDFGILTYSLGGTSSGIGHSLSNLQCKTDLPQTLDDYTNVYTLVEDITKVLKTGTHAKKVEIIYAKSK